MISDDSVNDNPFLKNLANSNNAGYDPYNSTSQKYITVSSHSRRSTDLENSDQSSQSLLEKYNKVDYFYHPSIISWSGRLGRLRFLAYNLFFSLLLIMLLLYSFDFIIEKNLASLQGFFALIFAILLVTIFISLAKRRLNDINLSGWYALLTLIPIVNIALHIVMFFVPGTTTFNKFGPRPIPSNNLILWGIVLFLIAANFIAISKYYDMNTAYLSAVSTDNISEHT